MGKIRVRRNKEKVPLLSELEEELEYEIANKRYSQLIQEGVFDEKEMEEQIELLKEKKLYKVLIRSKAENRKKESSKTITSIITKTITLTGFHFAVIAFILTNSIEISFTPSILYLFYGSIIVLFGINIVVLPILFLRSPEKSDYSEFVADINMIQSIVFLCILLGNIMISSFGIISKDMWVAVGIPGFILLMFILLIVQLRKRDREELDKILN